MELTTAQALVAWLAAQRAETLDGREVPLFPAVFAIFGHGNVLGLGTALYEHRAELPVWRGHTEQGMALAAIGYAKATDRRQVGVVTTSIGPGAANLVTAAGVAHANRLPLLLLPGDTFAERMALLRRPDGLREHLGDAAVRVNEFLTAAVDLVRARFHGPLTYAAIHWENVDWSRFEMISMDLYRSAEVADRFADGVRALVALGKPVAVTEFGASSFAGAAERGATGLDIVEYDDRGTPQRLDARYDRDEAAQAEYLRDLLTVFENEGVHAAFVFTFALYDHVHRPDGDPRADLDLASYGIVKVYEDRRGATYPEMAWEPKAAFHAVAEHYRRGVA